MDAPHEICVKKDDKDEPCGKIIIDKKLPRSKRKRLLKEQRLLNKRQKKSCLKEEKHSSLDKDSQVITITDKKTPTSNQGKRLHSDSDHVNKKTRKMMVKERCLEAMKSGQRICVDLSLEGHMNIKECGKLAQQLCRLYGSNRQSKSPAHVYFAGLKKEGMIYSECVRKNDGFEGYIVDMSEKPVDDLFKTEDIVYMSPDSENVLQTIDKDKVYVIGGLVDESIANNITKSKAEGINIATARLPIEEYMVKANWGTYTYLKVLAINQVFDIMLEFMNSGDWKKALVKGVPERRGYILKDSAEEIK